VELAGSCLVLVSERLATICPNAVVSDAERIGGLLPEALRQAHFTSFLTGRDRKTPCSGALPRLGLEPGRYFLYVSRMEPENNALLVREAFETLETDMKLALVGDAPTRVLTSPASARRATRAS